MPLISVPSKLFFTDVDIQLDRGTSTTRSPFTGKRQSRKRPYDLWRVSGGLMPLDPMDAGSMRSFLVQLNGQLNWFALKVPGAKYPLSSYTGVEGVVNGGAQSGKLIVTNGWALNTLIVKNGDYFNIGSELKVATADIASNGAGQATLAFEPPIRTPVPNATPIKVREPTVLLSSDIDEAAAWSVKPPIRYSFKIEATEHF